MNNISHYRTGVIFALLVLFTTVTQADVLELKDGTVLNGSYESGTKGTIRFNVKGQLKVISVNDIITLSFTGGSTSSAAKGASTTAAAAPSKGPKKIAAGTLLLVRTSQEIGTHNMKAGARFTTKLEAKLMSGSVQVAPQGALVYGKVVKSEKGGIGRRKAVLVLTLTEIMIDGQLRKITTSDLVGQGQSGGLGRKALKGAAIGGLADGHKGAETGAKVGVGIAILSGGKDAGIKNNSLIEFTLKNELKI